MFVTMNYDMLFVFIAIWNLLFECVVECPIHISAAWCTRGTTS